MRRGALALLFLAVGCGVPEEIYRARTVELDRCRADLTRTEGDLTQTRGRLEEEAGARERAANIESEYMRLKRDLNATEKQLDELKRARAFASERTEAYKALARRLAGVAGTTVTVRNNVVRVRVDEPLLFELGRAELKPGSEVPLRAVAAALREIVDRDFLVTAHTDNALQKGSPFHSNWELSSARAVSVVRLLQQEGVDPRHLAAAGYSEFDRLVDNDTPDHRAQNRRIEVLLLPRKEELPPIDLPTDPPSPPTALR